MPEKDLKVQAGWHRRRRQIDCMFRTCGSLENTSRAVKLNGSRAVVMSRVCRPHRATVGGVAGQKGAGCSGRQVVIIDRDGSAPLAINGDVAAGELDRVRRECRAPLHLEVEGE